MDELIDIVQTQAAAEGARGWVKVEEWEELKRGPIAGEDQPAGVAVLLHESETCVERRRRRKIARRKVRRRPVDHAGTVGGGYLAVKPPECASHPTKRTGRDACTKVRDWRRCAYVSLAGPLPYRSEAELGAHPRHELFVLFG